MSGGHFDYQQWRLTEIAQTIEEDIARALKPKPARVHNDYWTIYEKDSPGSFHPFMRYRTFNTYEEAEKFLLSYGKVRSAEPEYASYRFFGKNDVIFQSNVEFMVGTKDDEKIPVLYAIHHAEYDSYPDDADVLELEEQTIETMKEAYRQVCLARIYADLVDWMMSGDDGEDTLQERLKEELEKFDKEFKSKDWTLTDEEDED